jgi:TonB family protein
MIPAQALSNEMIWQQWEGRIVNARFPLQQYLGGSHHSAVYLTEVDGVKAVIKLVPADSRHAAAQIAAWKLAASLSHPSLVRILDLGLWHADEEQDMHFAIMEYCDESLAGVLRQRTLTADEARAMLQPCLEVLRFLHGRGLLHGQIKPSHILASGDQLKLSSDGVHRNGEAHPSPAVGPYDAPERTAGTISLSGDVWSLGVTLFEAMTNHLPGRGKNGVPVLPEGITPPFDAIIRGCLEADRERRLSVSAVRALLDRPAKEPQAALANTKPVGSTADTKSEATAATASQSNLVRMRMPAPEPQPAMAAPVQEPIHRPKIESKPEEKKWRIDRRSFQLIGAAVVVVLAIALILQLTHKNSKPASTLAGVSRESATVARAGAASAIRQPPSAATPGSVLHQELPEISAHARNTIRGTVKVRVRVSVDRQGKVSRTTLASRGASSYFAKQAVQAAKQWVFAAPVRNGAAQASDWTLHFEFRKSGTKVNAQPSA